MREEESLAAPEAERQECLALRLVLDALDDRLEVELLGDVRDGAHDLLALRLLVDALDQRAVDLQHVDRQASEVFEGRVAGAEVVERDAHAQLLDAR